jgi:hypothetical protein
MVDYKNGKIYKILNSVSNSVYIGSTTQKIMERFYTHKTAYNLSGKHHNYSSISLFEEDPSGTRIELIECFPCETKMELLLRERWWIENTENCINKTKPATDIKQYKKDYNERNKEQIRQTWQIYYTKNKDILNVKKKKYNEEHKQEVREKWQEYYTTNREAFRTKVKCLCGSLVRRGDYSKHIKRKLHISFIQERSRHFLNEMKMTAKYHKLFKEMK